MTGFGVRGLWVESGTWLRDKDLGNHRSLGQENTIWKYLCILKC